MQTWTWVLSEHMKHPKIMFFGQSKWLLHTTYLKTFTYMSMVNIFGSNTLRHPTTAPKHASSLFTQTVDTTFLHTYICIYACVSSTCKNNQICMYTIHYLDICMYSYNPWKIFLQSSTLYCLLDGRFQTISISQFETMLKQAGVTLLPPHRHACPGMNGWGLVDLASTYDA